MRPSHVLEQVEVDLPRPRDRKSSAFYDLTDRVYSLITESGVPRPARAAAPPVAPPSSQPL